MEEILLCFAVFVFAIGVIVIGYLDYKRMKNESDARTEMYNSICLGVTGILCQLRNIRYCFELFNINMFADAESEERK